MLSAAYVFHVLEEAYGGRGLAEWVLAHEGIRFTVASFFGSNLVGLALIVAATWAARRREFWRWTLISGGTILLANGVCHVAVSAAARRYVPGMWTGLALYIPLGAVLIFRLRRFMSPRVFALAIIAGFAIHAAVLWVVFGMPGFRPR
ncbi:MAG: HXXEE domain-containing protein [Candidatus Krumholzibacteria bacterium]|nr:HXXEE domain-containing protein [Candidatus Krumholzibacteria bacterium]